MKCKHCVSIPERVLEALKPQGWETKGYVSLFVSIPERVLEALKPSMARGNGYGNAQGVSIPERVLEALKLPKMNSHLTAPVSIPERVLEALKLHRSLEVPQGGASFNP